MEKTLRSDITGLRAVAVLAVALFHLTHVLKPFDFTFPGGFLGVDVFFVISGFLMTSIIIGGLKNDSFSVWEFYKRRAKRICPALLVVVIATALIGFFILKDQPYHVLTREAVTSLGFISNFRFAKSTDYFDGGDFTHLFLHTWSLSVEFQFYIFYPFLLIALKKCIGLNKIPLAILALTLFFLVVSIIWTEASPRQSYYLLPSRACELLVGSLAYFYPLAKIFDHQLFKNIKFNGGGVKYSAIYEVLGLLLIFISLFVIDDVSGWPTVWLVMPMFGTWLCIAANNHKSLLRHAVFQNIGLWSYALYLVHWPIIIYASALGLADYSLYLVVVIFLLSALLHNSIERRRDFSYKFLGLYFIFAGGIYVSEHIRPHNELNVHSGDTFEEIGGKDFLSDNVVLVNGDSPQLIIQGDSFAHEIVSSLAARDKKFIVNSLSGCYSIAGFYKSTWEERHCRLIYNMTKDLSVNYPNVPLLFIQNWSLYAYGDPLIQKIQNNKNFLSSSDSSQFVDVSGYDVLLYNSIIQIASDFKNRKVYLVGQKQLNMEYNTGQFPSQTMMPLNVRAILPDSLMQAKSKYVEWPVNEVIKKAVVRANELRRTNPDLGELVYIEPYNYCDHDKCFLVLDDEIFIYSDSGHYSWAGAEKPVTHLLKAMGMDPGQEITDFSKAPELDLDKIQTVLEYSEETGFKFPDEN